MKLAFDGVCAAVRRKASLAAVAAGAVALCASELRPAVAAEEHHIRLAEITFATSIMGKAVQKFADLITQKSGGRITVTVYPASQRGDEAQLLQTALSPAFKDVHMLSAQILTTVDRRHAATLLPFLFPGEEAVGAFSGSDAFAIERDQLLKTRHLRLLAAFDFPPENLYLKKPVHKLADLKDVKIRVPPSADTVKIFKLLGASPTPIALTQTYLAIQTGVVDGTMGSDDGALAYKFTDVVKYDINVHYQIVFNFPVVSERFFQSLPKDLQTVLVDSAREAAQWNHQQVVQTMASSRAQMAKAGVEVIDVSDIDAWKAAVKPMLSDYEKQYGDSEMSKIQALH
jgi:TRAP-type C4-dicarboxylate transport system substrate-binding protein